MRQSLKTQEHRRPAAIRPQPATVHPLVPAPVRLGAANSHPRRYRTSLRKQIQFETLVNSGLSHSVPWHVINLGLGGALIGMDRTNLEIGSRIDFRLRFTHRGRPIEHVIPATVIRQDWRGVALQFGDYNDATYTDLTDFLYDIED